MEGRLLRRSNDFALNLSFQPQIHLKLPLPPPGYAAMLSRLLPAFRQHGSRNANFFNSQRLASTKTPVSRIARLEARLPRFLQRYTTPLRNAPVSHITAFLLLHEVTAIVPIFGFVALFHYFNWLPPLAEGKWVKDGMEKFGKWLRKRGWIDDGRASEGGEPVGKVRNWFSKRWGQGEGGVRLVVEFATAYAITKALLPLRLVLSVWATPAFARWTVLPITWVAQRVYGRIFGGVVVAAPGAGAGTGAVGGGVLPKVGERVKTK